MGSCFDDRFYLPDHEIQLLILSVEMRRDTDSGTRSEINKEVATQQFLGYPVSIRHVDYDGAAAGGGVARAVHFETRLPRQLYQFGGLGHRFASNVFDADLIND